MTAGEHKQSTGQNFGPFVLERRLAVGGSAEVFLAHPKHGQSPAPRFVVKRLLPSVQRRGDFDALDREAALLQRIRHTNVVTTYGAGMVGDEPYLAMEYVEGVDLYRLLRRAEAEARRIPVGLAVFIARKSADALSAVHAATDEAGNILGIVHLDVTPSNLYLSRRGEVKLGDFGIARLIERQPSSEPSAGLRGKFGYLSPELVAGESVDHRADLFSLGAILGELLTGKRIFPGSGQLAVLLSIRDANIEPLEHAAADIPPELLAVCRRMLARDPGDRFQNATDVSDALAPFEQPSQADLTLMLSEWVDWATDSSRLAKRIEGKIRDSVQRMEAVRSRLTPTEVPRVPAAELVPRITTASAPTVAPKPIRTRYRRAGTDTFEHITLAKLIELIATGDLGAADLVSLDDAAFKPIAEIDELSRHLLPSTTATTSQIVGPGAPDFLALLNDTPMLRVLARMRQGAETGALFVELRDGSNLTRRKEIYLKEGRLLHVASNEREELLGEYMVRRNRITRANLDRALAALSDYDGRLGDTLIGLGIMDGMDVFRAIRDQGRDRVAALCTWENGAVTLYRGTAPLRVDFPLDLDLTSPMMAGILASSRGNPRSLLAAGETVVMPGPRADAARSRKERGTSPLSIQLIAGWSFERLAVDDAIARLTAREPEAKGRKISEQEACAALLTAGYLGWVTLQER